MKAVLEEQGAMAVKMMPDLKTWMQRFRIYASALVIKYSQYILELLAYLHDNMKASSDFKWLPWVITLWDSGSKPKCRQPALLRGAIWRY